MIDDKVRTDVVQLLQWQSLFTILQYVSYNM